MWRLRGERAAVPPPAATVRPVRRLLVAVPLLVVANLLVLLSVGMPVWAVTVLAKLAFDTARDESWERAPEALPVLRGLEREHVSFLRLQDWCQAYDDGSGVRANTLRPTCTLTRDAQVFDAASRARYDALARLAADVPYAVHYVEITYDGGGRMTRASLALDAGFSRESLVYEPRVLHRRAAGRGDAVAVALRARRRRLVPLLGGLDVRRRSGGQAQAVGAGGGALG
jgi:hypothetical protein